MSTGRVSLPVKERGDAERGTRNVRRLRRQGLVPGVLYGRGSTTAIVVGERELRSALSGPSGHHAIFDIVVEGGKEHHAVLKEFQRHPIRGTLTHIDFHEVRLDRPIQATVGVQLVGEARGSKVGGMVQIVTRDLRVEALPAAIPEHVEVDISDLDIGQSLRLEDVPAIEGVTFLDDPYGTVLATCSILRGLAVDEEEAEEEAAEGEAAEGEEGEAPEAAGDASEAPPEE